MPLSAGTRLGPYEIAGPLGAGGMGEVYRARDTRLDRIVAVKILPGHLAVDPTLRARFEREARAVSALNHPNICTLHDIGEQDGIHFLVMEHLEGETLAGRLQRGPMPPAEALAAAVQIAQGLAQAHRQGVIHRDLKPGNVMLTRTGAKLLDFGLARQGPEAAPPISSVVMTKASPLTTEGTIVGTWQYLSPEQLEGEPADHRSDLFAFGAVLYEMLTGRRAFEGRSQASLIASIMGSEPPPLSALAPRTPGALDRLVRRCLAKDPENRWQSAADLASELKWIAEGGAALPPAGSTGTGLEPVPGTPPSHATSAPWPSPGGSGMPTMAGGPGSSGGTSVTGSLSGAAQPVAGRAAGRTGTRLVWAGMTVFLVAAAAIYGARYGRGTVAPARPVKAALLPAEATRFDIRYPPAVSPDGSAVAYVALSEASDIRLWVRDLGSDQPRMLEETKDAAYPFFSADGKWIGFFADGKLKKIATAGGPAIALCDAGDGRGGTWNREGVIVFQPRFSDPLHKVSASGGASEPVTALDESRFDVGHRWPHFLPDGRRFLYYIISTTNPANSEHTGIYLGSLDSTESRLILKADSRMACVQERLLYKQGTTLMAQPFDAKRAELTGEPIPLVRDVIGGAYSWGGAEFGVSGSGVLVAYSGQGQGETELAWFDRSGKRLGTLGEPDMYSEPRLSHDGSRMVVAVGKDAGDLWQHDLSRDVRSRFTFDAADDSSPVWSPDDSTIVFASNRQGMGELYVRSASGSGKEELIHTGGTQLLVTDWSPDGSYLVFASLNRETSFDLWLWSFAEKQARPWFEAPGDQMLARFSPDGRWLAYTSFESGRPEVYVQSFPLAEGGRWQVSRAGGAAPVWRADGKELFFLLGDGHLAAVDVKTAGSVEFGSSQPLFRGYPKILIGHPYDAAPDGSRFVFNTLGEDGRTGSSALLILGWRGLE
ncbi:MAG TPA: protein kinase [Candidatus Polarisedimenticolia bacterium]|nr:protein kinase [Candidatus Polarisedimenticolia bacterium]